MHTLKVIQHPKVEAKFEAYPEVIKEKMDYLRKLVLNTANEIENIKEIEETLKWGEPSYLVKRGSTIRMNWKAKAPNQYALYFNCNTSLVETFKVLYGNLFQYEKNRAIVFDINEELPEQELKSCIEMALQYHSLKDKPLLGY